MKLLDVLVINKMASSKSDARRLIEQGAVMLNDNKITSIDEEARPGILRVGKRKFLKIGKFERLHANFSSGGYLSLEVKPLNSITPIKDQYVILAEALAKAIMSMEQKGYVDISSQLGNTENLYNHFLQLFVKKLINFTQDKNGNFEIDMFVEPYIQKMSEIENYVIMRDKILNMIKNNNDKNSWINKMECPNCRKSEVDWTYNTINSSLDEKFNANGICRNCGFKFNELV